jgi:hypothetical protein
MTGFPSKIAVNVLGSPVAYILGLGASIVTISVCLNIDPNTTDVPAGAPTLIKYTVSPINEG